jgi:asparagine synthase (glutamine-hydrolysing)
MSGVALAAGDDPAEAAAAVDAMLARSPHRGSRRLRAGADAAVVGAAVADDRPDDGSVASAGPWSCSFAGVLDNRAALASELGLAPDASAAEVALTGLVARGDAFANAMRGVYGVVATDGREVVAWRDHIGLMPLFYRVEPRRVIVATEAKQVVAGAGLPYEPDLDVVVAIVHEDVTDDTPAALRGVARLRKGCVLRVGPDRAVRTTGYWQPEAILETARYADDELQDRFDALMAQAVARSMRGDDVLLLSGGIDSPAIAAYGNRHALEAYGHPLDALSTVYPDYPAVDESELIRLVASRLGMPLRTYTFDAPHLAELQDWMRLADGPVPTVVLADAADAYRRSRALGRTTVLTGDLAEFVIDQRDHVAAHYLRRGQVGHLARELGYRRGRPRAARRIAAELAAAVVPHAVKAAVRDRRPPNVRPMLAPWLEPSRHLLPRVAEKSPAGRRWREGQYRFLEGPGLSVEADEACQEACGVRARHPWVDVDLWELFLSLPAGQKFPGPETKALVRRLLRGRVPDEILDRRRKVVFNDAVVGRIDYDALTRWLKAPTTRLPGVDYELLWQRVERRDLDIVEYMWAKDLAATHAFLALWD